MKNFFRVALLLAAIVTWASYAASQISGETRIIIAVLGLLGAVAVGTGIEVFIMWLFGWFD